MIVFSQPGHRTKYKAQGIERLVNKATHSLSWNQIRRRRCISHFLLPRHYGQSRWHLAPRRIGELGVCELGVDVFWVGREDAAGVDAVEDVLGLDVADEVGFVEGVVDVLDWEGAVDRGGDGYILDCREELDEIGVTLDEACDDGQVALLLQEFECGARDCCCCVGEGDQAGEVEKGFEQHDDSVSWET